MPCPDCGQREEPLRYLNTDPANGDLYRCPKCGSVWYADELEVFEKEAQMYQYENPNVDKYKQMEHMIIVLLPSYLARHPGKEELAAAIIKEFANMEAARATIVGVDDTAAAVADYLNHHFQGGPKPTWYDSLTK